ncbi:MAG: cytochrome c peroxidase [Rubricoccaceae bacterium]|nr:cytochrome c peroxidase [Rubricoccaceae bacterium]
MYRIVTVFSLGLLIVLGAFAVRVNTTEPVLPETHLNYANIELPAHLQRPANRLADNTPSDNRITDAGATLGRVLFYDKRLSRNQTTACGSCHLQEHGFADTTAFSTGFEGELTDRNAMSLSFARFYTNGRFFWDERAETLEAQTLMPIQDPVEMGMTLDEVVERLEATTFYAGLFEDAFGTPEITPDRMSKALAQFIRSIVAPNSKFDQGRILQGGGRPGSEPLPNFTDSENRGMELFFGVARCSECHSGDMMAPDRVFSNGLDRFPEDQGAGFGRFKANSLRNIELTAPYMHDGRFNTLEEVVNHYDREIRPHSALFVGLRSQEGGGPIRLNLSEYDRQALVDFLKTLTDTTLATDERWSNPFPEEG